jgi:hypothetical protein
MMLAPTVANAAAAQLAHAQTVSNVSKTSSDWFGGGDFSGGGDFGCKPCGCGFE